MHHIPISKDTTSPPNKRIHKRDTPSFVNRTIFDVVLPFCFLAKLFGYFAFTLIPPSPQTSVKRVGDSTHAPSTSNYFRTSVLDLALFVANIAIGVALLNCERKMLQKTTYINIFDIGVPLVLLYSSVITILSNVMVFVVRRKVVGAIVKMQMIDQEVYRIYISYYCHVCV